MAILTRKPGGGGGGSVDLSGYLAESLYDANSVLAADADDAPAALTMGPSTMLARLAAGNIKAASVAEIQALLGVTVKIGDIDLTATQAFTAIPGTYSDLKLVLIGRGTQAAATVVANLRFNSDSGTNYESNLINISNNTSASSATPSQTEAILSVFPAASAVANRAGMAIVEIPEYAGGFHKILRSECHTIYDTAASNYVTQLRGIQWRNTAAITRIDVTLSAGAWAAGSTARLYGTP